MLGLVELLFILAIGVGWAVLELRSLRRDRRAPTPQPGKSDGSLT